MNFWDTNAGYNFARYTVPRLTESIEQLVEELKKMNEPMEEVLKKANESEMLHDTLLLYTKKNLKNPILLKHFLSIWTSYCIFMGYEVDTSLYDGKMADLWNVLSKNECNPFTEFDEFYGYMCQNLV